MLSNPHQYLNCARQFIAGKFLPCIFTLTVFFIYWSVPLFAAESEGGGSQLLDFIWKVVNVTVLLAIIYKFAKKPLANALNNSASTAKKVIDDAREAEENISAELNEMRSKIAGLEEEAVQMVNSAKKEAELEKERIIEEGRQEIERMKKQASFALDQERRKAEDDLRHWIAEESVNLAENKLKQEMDQNQQNKLVTKYMDQNTELREVLSDIKVSSRAKLEILKGVLNEIKAPALVDTFSRYLLSKRRIDFLPDIERAFNLLLQEKLGRIEADVTTAYELPDETVKNMEDAISSYSGKEVEVNVTIDPSIIGGIVTRIGSMVIDGSIQTQLNQIRQSIIKG